MTCTDNRLAEIEAGITEVRTGIALLADEMRLHGELLGRIIEILTPEAGPSGTSLQDLVAALIGRLDRQSVLLREILLAQGALACNLPGEATRAINDLDPNSGVAPPHIDAQATNGNGQTS